MTQRARGRGRGVHGVSSRVAAWAAWTLCGLTIVLVCCVVVFAFVFGVGLQELVFLVSVVASALVGAVVASRRPRNPIGWFFVLSAVCFALSEASFRYAAYGLVLDPGSLPLADAVAWPSSWLWVPGVALVLIFVPLYFPTGQLLSPRWRPVLWLAVFVSVTLAVLGAFAPGSTSGVRGVTNPLGIEALHPVSGKLGDVVEAALSLPVFLASLFSLVVRFWRSRGEERQQMKWITYAAGAMFTMVVLVSLLDVVAPNSILAKVASPLTGAMFAGIPVAVGIAVLKYRLYDIDILINRTLVYGSLTVTLAAAYLGSIVLLQTLQERLLVFFTGAETTPLTVVVSTLVIAALFNPLRRRIQAFIDRLFYRSKYDARKTLDAFSAKLRDETDLDSLGEDLMGVVKETMQPSHISLWLHPDPALKDKQRRANIRESGHEE